MPLTNASIKVQRTVARNNIDKGPFFMVSFSQPDPMTFQTELDRDHLYLVQDQLNRLIRALPQEQAL
jgi:hypothetical protein